MRKRVNAGFDRAHSAQDEVSAYFVAKRVERLRREEQRERREREKKAQVTLPRAPWETNEHG